MTIKLTRLFSVLLLLLAWSVEAVNVPNLYTAIIPVPDQEQTTRNQAIIQGVNQVLIKVSGNPSTPTQTSIKATLTKPNDLVQQYNYDQNTDSATAQQFPYQLTIKFLPAAINRVLADNNIAIWSQDRPLTIFWLGLDAAGTQKLIGASDTSPILNALDNAAQGRGIPIIFPVLDLTDLNQITTADVFNATTAPIKQASTRYGSNALVISRFKQQGTHWQVAAILVASGNTTSWNFAGTDLNVVAQQLVDAVANSLAQQFALNSANQKQIFMVQINNLQNLASFVQARKYLQKLAPVSNVLLVSMNKNQAIFALTITGDTATLQKAINLDQTLTAVNSEAPEQNLIYQWTP